uniref:Uncharacterized protein n=1 Tax=Rhizobium leguminosarum bv. viciae TaxID=387 RepID=A0A0U3AU24_RHILV|nr:hypothetical protein [Rhizobium leguminosarum bv. viciae]
MTGSEPPGERFEELTRHWHELSKTLLRALGPGRGNASRQSFGHQFLSLYRGSE